MAGIKIKKNRFGLLSDGTKVHLYTVSNGNMSISMTDFGCTLTSIVVPSKKNSKVDVLLGYSTLDGLINDHGSYGVLVGRFANRIGGAAFSLEGKTYNLDKNDNGINTLHGGFDRWEKKVWDAKKVKTSYGTGIQFTRKSFDGEQGFPGNLFVTVTYTLSEDNIVTLAYDAVTDKATPINLTNHAYFNLKGHNSGSVAGQNIMLNCSNYVEVDSNLIPTGKLLPVKGTPFDFTTLHAIGDELGKVGFGYDHCYCVDGYTGDGSLKIVGLVEEPESGLKMEVRSTKPGIQFYTGNFIENIPGKNGAIYQKQTGLCLETEYYPDAPNQDSFPSSILHPGETYKQVTQYAFEF